VQIAFALSSLAENFVVEKRLIAPNTLLIYFGNGY
jgi:hypothetical protein